MGRKTGRGAAEPTGLGDEVVEEAGAEELRGGDVDEKGGTVVILVGDVVGGVAGTGDVIPLRTPSP